MSGLRISALSSPFPPHPYQASPREACVTHLCPIMLPLRLSSISAPSCCLCGYPPSLPHHAASAVILHFCPIMLPLRLSSISAPSCCLCGYPPSLPHHAASAVILHLCPIMLPLRLSSISAPSCCLCGYPPSLPISSKPNPPSPQASGRVDRPPPHARLPAAHSLLPHLSIHHPTPIPTAHHRPLLEWIDRHHTPDSRQLAVHMMPQNVPGSIISVWKTSSVLPASPQTSHSFAPPAASVAPPPPPAAAAAPLTAPPPAAAPHHPTIQATTTVPYIPTASPSSLRHPVSSRHVAAARKQLFPADSPPQATSAPETTEQPASLVASPPL
ncbi:unnamed protein product [Closterium sp. NIES-64]|nr:unnamed protein product [Closterium sp. NIES-64]